MKKIALLVINHDTYIEYDNHIYLIMHKNMKLLGYKTITLKNEKCSKKNVISQLKKLRHIVSLNDKFIFYFCGHTIWSPLKKGFKFFDFKPYHILFGGKQNWLSTNFLMNILDQIKCKKILLFDTCCGPLIQLNRQENTQIITVSNKLGKSFPIYENNCYTPHIAFFLESMLQSREKYASFYDYIKSA